jgi:hypothetical protein
VARGIPLTALAVVLLAGCGSQPAPTLQTSSPVARVTAAAEPSTPRQAGAELVIEGTIEESCGSIGGCAYLATLIGPGDAAREPIALAHGEGGVLALRLDGLPTGDYRLRIQVYVRSDSAIVGQPRELGPLSAACGTPFTIADDATSVTARARFLADECGVRVEIASDR